MENTRRSFLKKVSAAEGDFLAEVSSCVGNL